MSDTIFAIDLGNFNRVPGWTEPESRTAEVPAARTTPVGVRPREADSVLGAAAGGHSGPIATAAARVACVPTRRGDAVQRGKKVVGG